MLLAWMSLSARPLKALALALGGALLLPSPLAALDEQAGPEKYKESEKIAVDFLKGAAKGDSEKMIDVAITVASLGFPPAGIALGVIKGVFMSMSTTPDPVAEAIKGLDRRLSAAEGDIKALQTSVQQLRNETLKIENRARLGELEARQYELGKLRNVLLERPTGQAAKSLIDDSLRFADRFLAVGEFGENMWYWSDIRVYTDPATRQLQSAMLPKRFEPDLMLETYLQSLALFAAAVRHGGYSDALRPRIERHAAFLTENPAAHADWPMPLPARMQGRISCDSSVPSMQYPDRDGVCRNTIVCDEAFPDAAGHAVGERRPYLNKKVELANVNLGDWCPKDMLVNATPQILDLGDRVGDSGIVQRIELLALAASTLSELGKLKDPQFDYTYFYPQYFYAVTSEGELVEYIHEIVEDRNPQKDPLAELGVQAKVGDVVKVEKQTQPELEARGIQSKVLRGGITRDAVVNKDAAVAVQAPSESVRDAAVMVKSKPVIRQRLVGPHTVATGWGANAKAQSAGVYGLGAAIYVVTPDGGITWQRHDNYRGGTSKWTAPVAVGSGWNQYARIFAAGDGVLYGIDTAGDLYWNRQLDAANASAQPRWSPRAKVGNGWGHFPHVFSGGLGVVYAVHPDGRLLWYRHTGYLTGAPTWEGPKEVGTGWSHFRNLFATSEGRIYAVQPNGDLYFYNHTGWADGQPAWEPYVVLGKGFDRFPQLFAAMWGTPPADHGPK